MRGFAGFGRGGREVCVIETERERTREKGEWEGGRVVCDRDRKRERRVGVGKGM